MALSAGAWIASGRGVIGRHSLDGDIFSILHLVAIIHHEAVLEVSEDGLVDVDRGRWRAQRMDGFTVEVVFVLVGNQDDVGLGESGIIGLWFQPHANGIDLNLYTVIVDLHTGVLNARDLHFLATLRGKLICLLSGKAPNSQQTGECHHK